MFTTMFWKSAAERSVRAAAAAFLSLTGNELFDFIALDARQVGGILLGAAVSSVALSLVASGVGDKGTTSFLPE